MSIPKAPTERSAPKRIYGDSTQAEEAPVEVVEDTQSNKDSRTAKVIRRSSMPYRFSR